MICYEIKKILSNRSGKIASIVLLLVLVITSYLAITDVTYVDDKGVTHKGVEAAKSLRLEKQRWEGYVTEELLQAVIAENEYVNERYPYISDIYSIENEIHYSKKQGISDISRMINHGFCEFREFNYYRVDSVTKDEVYDMYANRTASLKRWLYSDEAINAYTEEEKAFLIDKYNMMDNPLYYADADGWKTALEHIPALVMFVMFIVAFLVSGIFSNEFRWKADAIFFSTRYGRDRGTKSKIVAGCHFTT